MRLRAFAVVALLAPRTLVAQTISGAEYAARRDSLAARLDSGIVVAFGAPAPTGFSRPTQLPAFRYLTGFLEPDAAAVLVARGGRMTGTLFLQARDPSRALYDGFPPDSSVVAQETGLSARSFSALRPMLDSLAGTGLPVYTLRDFSNSDYAREDSLTRGASFMRAFASAHPGLAPRDAHPILDSLRARKSPAEQAMLRRAIDITVGAQREAMRTVRPGMYEYQVEALFQSAFRRTGGDGPAFVSIVGSGPNSTQYHYNANDRRMAAGDVLVMDVGAGYGGYAADVTRTVPVSGTFTREQRAVYQIVRDAQAAAERVAGPGAPYQAWRDSSRAVVARGVARLGLTQGVDATFDPPWADSLPAGLVSLSPGLPLHGPRTGPWDRSGRARPPLCLDRPGGVRAGRRVHHRAGHLREHTAVGHAAGHAKESRNDRCGARRGRALQQYRDPNRGRLSDHGIGRGVALARAARDRRGRSRHAGSARNGHSVKLSRRSVETLACLASGVLLFFGTGLHPLWPLTWLAPVPVLVLALRVPVARAFFFGGLAMLLGGLNEVFYLAHLAPVPVVALALLLPSLAFGLAVLVFRFAARRWPRPVTVLALPAAWTAFEFFLSFNPGSGSADQSGVYPGDRAARAPVGRCHRESGESPFS